MTIWGVHLDGHENLRVEITLDSLKSLVEIKTKDFPYVQERLTHYSLKRGAYVVTEDDGPFDDEWYVGLAIPAVPEHTIERYEWQGTDEPLTGSGWTPRGELKWEI